MVCLLLLETAMLGALVSLDLILFYVFWELMLIPMLVSLDLILFYVFWELMLIPMYLLIGVWGGPQKIYAAVKFFMYTAAGSVFMLLSIIFLYYYNYKVTFMLLSIIFLYYYNYKVTGVYTFSILELYKLNIPISVQFWHSLSPLPSRCRGSAENGYLWISALCHAAVSLCYPSVHAGYGHFGGNWNYLRCPGSHGTA